METWLLVLITAFTGQSYGHPVGAGGLSTSISISRKSDLYEIAHIDDSDRIQLRSFVL